MTEPDMLLERLERINPVPDPLSLYEEPHGERRPVPVPTGGVQTRGLRRIDTPMRRGLVVATAVGALVIMAVAALSGIANDSNGFTTADARVLQLTIDGDSCVYEGPAILTAGEAQINYRNASPEIRWANTLRLDDDRTISDVLNSIAADPLSGAPSWSSPVWLALAVPVGGEPRSRAVTLEPGTHVLLCGDADRGAVFGAEVLVTP